MIFKQTRYVGEGGFGILVIPIDQPNMAYKLLKSANCVDAKKEALIHNHIYSQFMRTSHTYLDLMHIAQPLFFTSLYKPITFDSPRIKGQTNRLYLWDGLFITHRDYR
jgi:hypothetical protein|uniref:Uncharacterized protein n=1 Tax=viral metagenome TaxID=1070528 RepID=A0A6C0BIZ9_9ZZZZ